MLFFFEQGHLGFLATTSRCPYEGRRNKIYVRRQTNIYNRERTSSGTIAFLELSFFETFETLTFMSLLNIILCSRQGRHKWDRRAAKLQRGKISGSGLHADKGIVLHPFCMLRHSGLNLPFYRSPPTLKRAGSLTRTKDLKIGERSNIFWTFHNYPIIHYFV